MAPRGALPATARRSGPGLTPRWPFRPHEGAVATRILVTAASRHEATTEVAQAIARTLERAELEVEMRRPEEVGHLSAYDAVVLGSAICAGQWLEPAKDLVERTSAQMRTL